MWPWGHAAVGYLLYSLYSRGRYRRPPPDLETLVLVVCTQVPDLVDKPLAYWLHVVPEGRSLAHSLVVAVPLCALAWLVAARRDHSRVGTAAVLGYFSHLLGDSYGAVLAGRVDRLTFLLWPVLAPPDYQKGSFVQHWRELVGAVDGLTVAGVLAGQLPSPVYQGVVAIGVLGLWALDGYPGLASLRAVGRRRWPFAQ